MGTTGKSGETLKESREIWGDLEKPAVVKETGDLPRGLNPRLLHTREHAAPKYTIRSAMVGSGVTPTLPLWIMNEVINIQQ